MILALVALAAALESGDEVRFELRGGTQVEGYALSASDDVLVVSSAAGRYEVPTPLVSRVWVDGVELDVAAYALDLEAFRLTQLESRGLGPGSRRVPPPLVVGTASALWPGAGHLILGDLGGFVGYSTVELALLGAAAWWVFGAELVGPLIPLALLDISFRSYAVADTVRETRRRRPGVVVAPRKDGGAVVQIVWGSPLTQADLTAWGPIP